MSQSHLVRRLLTGANAGLMTVLVIVAVVVAVDMTSTHHLRVDLSDDRASTLSSQTIETLSALATEDVDVVITAFSSQQNVLGARSKDRALRDFLTELSSQSQRVQHAFISFDADRITAERLGVTNYGSVVIEALGDRVDIPARHLFRRFGEGRFAFVGEEIIGNAVNRILRGNQGVLYALIGHGENSISGADSRSVTRFTEILKTQGIELKSVDLLQNPSPNGALVPEDAAAVLLFGPRTALAPIEEEALQTYLSQGGGVGIFVEPDGFVPDLLEDLGIMQLSGIVHDDFALYPHEEWPILRLRNHEITAPLLEKKSTTSMARGSAFAISQVEGCVTVPLLTTSQRAWIERDGEKTERGVKNVALAVELSDRHRLLGGGSSARVVAFGDADIFTDELLEEVPGNIALGINTVRWLSGDDGRISSGGRDMSARRLVISGSQLRWVMFFLMGILPVGILITFASVRSARDGK
jgi:ABC-2 type transport system permease protein